MAGLSFKGRRLLVPEVVQTSAMDCGPASLKCLLEGYGIPVSYGRLREACQTDVDGTSIDTIEEVAVRLGVEAEQIMVPPDHLLLPEANALPAVVVVRRAGNATHFVIVWRRHGRLLQVMDPAVGRRWVAAKSFLEEVYVHASPVPAEAWREWAGSEEFTGALRRRLRDLGIPAATTKRMLGAALGETGWLGLAALDASVRMAEAVVRSGAIRGGRQAARIIERFSAGVLAEGTIPEQVVPAEFWSVSAAPLGEEGEEQVLLRGAVLVRALRRSKRPLGQQRGVSCEPGEEGTEALSAELVAALEEPPSRPAIEFIRLLYADGLFSPLSLLTALAVAAAGAVIEALLFRGIFDIGRDLNLEGQRLGAIGALVAFVTALLLLELPMASMMLRLGRGLETRLRMLFMKKIPLLGDRYFHSRLISDMAERSHSTHRVRSVPVLGGRFIRLIFELVLTTAGIIWLDAASAPLALLAAALAVGFPLAAEPVLIERDLRVRNHNGGLSRFYLDALVGLFAVRAHGAERAMRREHESLLLEWAGASLGFQRAVVVTDALQSLVGFGLAAWLILDHFSRAGESGGLLLFAYWVLNLPVIGQGLAQLARQYTDFRNVTLRLLEPLGAREETTVEADMVEGPALTSAIANARRRGVSLSFKAVTVRASGHTILRNINLSIGAGEHVAVAGPSGAGKSTLVGLLLGWQRAAEGVVLVDDAPLDDQRLEELRRETAWVDPTVQLWNRTFLENLLYGFTQEAAPAVNEVIEMADLLDVLEGLPDGLQTLLGEGGALVSGGQGQRVRVGRAMVRSRARLVILDEPFRGLERERRREMLARARALWQDATLICITHDVGSTQSFNRAVVIHEGEAVEDDSPARLAARPGSRYRSLLEAEEDVRAGMWSSALWRRLTLQDRRLSEDEVRTEEGVRTNVGA
ncbi:MAG TPA: ATP-binding cassette domain-containing protein [Pyrinomonadaceae bacterium]|jgi:ATP-binding cassette subfamily B protein